jgi:hypothetical protein
VQNSLSRLFEGMAHALHHVVLPSVGDDYARAQVTACIEILGNLEARVDWSAEQRSRRADLIVTALPELAATLPAEPELAPVQALVSERSPSETVELEDAHRGLATLQRWLAEHPEHPAAAVVAEVVVEDLREELERLRTARFGR